MMMIEAIVMLWTDAAILTVCKAGQGAEAGSFFLESQPHMFAQLYPPMVAGVLASDHQFLQGTKLPPHCSDSQQCVVVHVPALCGMFPLRRAQAAVSRPPHTRSESTYLCRKALTPCGAAFQVPMLPECVTPHGHC